MAGNRRSIQSYIFIYSSFKTVNLIWLWSLSKVNLNFCVRSTPSQVPVNGLHDKDVLAFVDLVTLTVPTTAECL